MPLFYLHLCDGEGYHRDEEGLKLADVRAARFAIAGLRDTLAGEILGYCSAEGFPLPLLLIEG
jgi:hypothetical protein